MRLHDSVPTPGSTKRRKRIGCGESSGHGKTSTRGNKGQKSRSGAAIRPGFEGGQMPMHRRLPKKGFTNGTFKNKVVIVNVGQLDAFDDGSTVSEAALRDMGLVRGRFDWVKVLGDGDVTKKLTVTLSHVSAGAKEKIEKAGGTVAAAS